MLLTKRNVKELISGGQMKELGFDFTFMNTEEQDDAVGEAGEEGNEEDEEDDVLAHKNANH